MIKAHKLTKNYPSMRIVASTIGSPPYETSKYLVDIIQPTLNKSNISVMNSSSFVTEAKQWTPDPNEIQVSCDAVNLYSSVPIKKSTGVIIEETGATIKTRIKQHQKAVFENKKNDSALLQNMQTFAMVLIQWHKSSILASENKFFRRSVSESLEIQRQGTEQRRWLIRKN